MCRRFGNNPPKTMIPNHARFVEALKDKKKVRVQFYSKADGGVVDRVFAPMAYGPSGGENNDGLNRYWLWDYSSDTARALGLVPQQIVDLQMLGETFDPAEFASAPAPTPSAHGEDLPPAPVASGGGPPNPGL